MTSLVAWIAVDQRAPSAFYMASDSRISWGSAQTRWDAGRKLFLCRQHADIFGYVGDVVFPSLVLGQITEAADAGLLFHRSDDSDKRHDKFVAAVRASFARSHKSRTASFAILHASRHNFGRKAEFRLWRMSFQAGKNSWSDSPIPVPHSQSKLLVILGSGERSVRSQTLRWDVSDQGGTSRAIFSAFCDSLRSSADAFSGGPPRLVGMYHSRLPQAFGIIYGGQRYLHGIPLPLGLEPKAIEWRDELFQRVDGRTLELLRGAQRHVRPR